MLIYTIIVTYNGSKWLDRCFGSLVDSTVATKILAIDNKSNDGTPEAIRSKFPSVEVIEAGENLGFGKANNIGLVKALNENADYVFLLNQDAWVEADTIEKLVSVQSPEYAILSPMHLNGQGNALDMRFANYVLASLNPDVLSDIYLSRIKARYDIKYANAAAWLLSMHCVEQIGGFDPSFFMYGEDDNYIHRVQYFGYKIGFCPSARIYHDRSFRDQDEKPHIDVYKKTLRVNFRDLNRSLLKITTRFFIDQMKSALKSFLCLRLKDFEINIYIIFFIIASFHQIIMSRKEAKKKGAFLQRN